MLDSTSLSILVFFTGFIASFIGTIGAGAGLVSLPLLLLLGFPPQISIAMNKLGSLGFAIGPLKTYHKHKKIMWQYVLPFIILSIVGTAIGANILINIDATLLSKLIGTMLLFVVAFMFFKKDLGVKKRVVGLSRLIVGYILKFFVYVWGGFLGSGSGVLSGFVNFTFFGFTVIESKATGKIPSIISGITAVIIFAFAGIIDYANGFILLLGMFIGAYAGGHVIIKKGDKWAKDIVMVVVLISAVKLLFF